MADDGGINAKMAVGLSADISALVRELRKAGDATDTGMSRIERRMKDGEARMKNSVDLMKLEMDLDVARVKGDKAVVASLEKEVALRRQIASLAGRGVAVAEARAMAEAHQAALAAARHHAEHSKEGVGAALEQAFGSSRLAVLEEGGAKLGIYGGALEKLGGAGLIAAAGLAAFGISLEEAHKAMEFADEVANTARKLHVTTDALQEYRFALGEVGGAEKGADDALEQFSSMLGKAQAGLPKAIRAFKELGFSKGEVDSFKTVEDALDAVTEKVGHLGSNVQKDAIIDQLGLTGMKPLIEAGAEKMKELREEAQKLGIVMDGELIQRGAEMNKKFDVLSKVISVQLKSAFVDLGPVILALTGLIADMSRGLADMLQMFKPIEQKTVTALEDEKAAITRSFKSRQASVFKPDAAETAEYNRRISDIDKVIADKKAKMTALVTPPSGGGSLHYPGAGGSKHNGTADAEASVRQSLDGALKDRLTAYAALTGGIMEHAQAEHEAIDAETKSKLDRLATEAAKIDADKSILGAKKSELNSQLRLAAAAEVQAADAKKKKIDNDATIALVAHELAVRTAIAGYDDQVLQAQISLSDSATERKRLELEQLKNQKDLADAERKAKADAEALKNPPNAGDITVKANGEQAAADRAYQAHIDLINQKYESPWEKWAQDGKVAAADVGNALQSYAVKGMDDFNNGVADAIVNGHNLGDTMKSILKGMEADLVRYLMKQSEIGLFGGGNSASPGLLHMIGVPGFARGTDSAPGGLALVGEHGPEIVNLKRGAQVVPNNLLRSFAGRQAPVIAHTTIIQGPTYQLQSPVVTNDLLMQMSAISASHAQRAAASAVSISKRGQAAWSNSDFLLSR